MASFFCCIVVGYQDIEIAGNNGISWLVSTMPEVGTSLEKQTQAGILMILWSLGWRLMMTCLMMSLSHLGLES